MWCREPFCISRKRCAIFTCEATIIVRQDTPHHVTRVQICNGNGRSISVTDYVSLCETFAIGSSPNCLDQTVPLLWHMAVDKWCGWFTTPSPRINQSSPCAAYIVKRNTLHYIEYQQFCPSDFLGGYHVKDASIINCPLFHSLCYLVSSKSSCALCCHNCDKYDSWRMQIIQLG